MGSNLSLSRRAGGVLYVVATPIGNPGDITARALATLAEADLIACEDTRRTARLLSAHQIHTPMMSYFEHNEERRTAQLIERLRAGSRIALVSDAGTPTVSDPGFRLVRAALEADIRVAAVPGPSAALAALSVAGLPTDRFVFEGFPPRRSAARRQRFESLSSEPRTMIFFEAARRLKETLEAMEAAFGPGRRASITREMTKTYEQVAAGSLKELVDHVGRDLPRGEVSIVVAGAARPATAPAPSLDRVSVELLCSKAGLSLKQASAIVAGLRGVPRRDVYQEALRERRQHGASAPARGES